MSSSKVLQLPFAFKLMALILCSDLRGKRMYLQNRLGSISTEDLAQSGGQEQLLTSLQAKDVSKSNAKKVLPL